MCQSIPSAYSPPLLVVPCFVSYGLGLSHIRGSCTGQGISINGPQNQLHPPPSPPGCGGLSVSVPHFGVSSDGIRMLNISIWLTSFQVYLCNSAQITYPLLLITHQDIFQHGIYAVPIVLKGLIDFDIRYQRRFVISGPCIREHIRTIDDDS